MKKKIQIHLKICNQNKNQKNYKSKINLANLKIKIKNFLSNKYTNLLVIQQNNKIFNEFIYLFEWLIDY